MADQADITRAVLAAQRSQSLAQSYAGKARESALQVEQLYGSFLRTALIWKGPWSSSTLYRANDIVENDGSSYVCVLQHTNHEPPNSTYWNLVASKGDTGSGGSGSAWIVDFTPGSSTTNHTVLNALITTVFGLGGGTVRLPPGNVDFEGAIVCRTGVSVVGAGEAATTVRATGALLTTGDLFSVINTRGVHLQGFKIGATAPRSGGRAIYIQGGDGGTQLGSFDLSASETFVDVDMEDQFDGCVIENYSTLSNWDTFIGAAHRTGLWRNFTGGDALRIDCNGGSFYGASHFVNKLFIANDSPTTEGVAIHIVGTGDFNVGNCETFGFKYGLHINPPTGGRLTTGRFHNCFFDTSKSHAALIEPHSGSFFGDITFEGCWFAGAGLASGLAAHGVLVNNPAGDTVGFPNNAIMTFVNCHSLANHDYGMVFTGGSTGPSRIIVSACHFSGNALGGFRAVNANKWSLMGCTFGNANFINVGSLPQTLAVQVDSGCTDFIVAYNILNGGTFTDNSGAVTKIVTPNIA